MRARPQESGSMLLPPPPQLLSPVSHLQTPAWHNLTSLPCTLPTSLGISNKIDLAASLNFPQIPLEPGGKWEEICWRSRSVRATCRVCVCVCVCVGVCVCVQLQGSCAEHVQNR